MRLVFALGQLILGMLSGPSLSLECDESLRLCQFVNLLRKAKKAEEEERSECVNCDTLKPKKHAFHTQGIIGEERKSQLIHWVSPSKEGITPEPDTVCLSHRIRSTSQLCIMSELV